MSANRAQRFGKGIFWGVVLAALTWAAIVLALVSLS